MAKITITLDLSDAESLLLRTCSLERVLNNALRIAERAARAKRLPDDVADAVGCALGDIPAVKPLARKLWDTAREECMKARG